MTLDPERDLILTRVIRAPRGVVWDAWTDPASFEKWWVPAPALCQVVEMDMRAGGAFATRISEDGAPFAPHIDGCFLDIVEGRRIVFTTALVGGWRPARDPFMTAVITLNDHPLGVEYTARAMHKDPADQRLHRELGFDDGWGTVVGQLADLVEGAGR